MIHAKNIIHGKTKSKKNENSEGQHRKKIKINEKKKDHTVLHVAACMFS